MPSWELFDAQEPDYRAAVLPAVVIRRVVVEAAASQGWERYLGPSGRAIGIDTFGASAPGGDLLREYGLSVDRILDVYAALS